MVSQLIELLSNKMGLYSSIYQSLQLLSEARERVDEVQKLLSIR